MGWLSPNLFFRIFVCLYKLLSIKLFIIALSVVTVL